jgi:hypothetical protein
MESFVFNVAKGRVAEFHHRVDANDPANSALIVVPLSVGGTQAQGQDFATLSALLADAAWDEMTTGGWVRKTLTDTNITDITTDNTNNVNLAAIPNTVFTTPTGAIVGVLICYDADTTSGTDANIIPMTAHAYPFTGTGVDATLGAANYYEAM